MRIRKAKDRGHANFGWLDSHHTFSFGEYFDPDHMGFGPLRVINDDIVAPGAGFPTHPHKDMEIVSYVLDGALEHRDSTGGGSIIRPGEVQRMSAGSGIRHSEFNASQTDPVHFLQIWILPDKQGIDPGYEQKEFAAADKRGKLCLVASPDGRQGSVTIHQDAELRVALLGQGESVRHELGASRLAWVQLAHGCVLLNGAMIEAGDGVAIDAVGAFEIAGVSPEAEALVFDMAG